MSQSSKDDIVRTTIQFCQVRWRRKLRGHQLPAGLPRPCSADWAALKLPLFCLVCSLLQKQGFIPVNCCPAMPINDTEKWQQWSACLWWV